MRHTPCAGYDTRMHRLLAVSDLYLDPAEIEHDAQARLPQLPALSELLHLGRARPRHRGLARGTGDGPGRAHARRHCTRAGCRLRCATESRRAAPCAWLIPCTWLPEWPACTCILRGCCASTRNRWRKLQAQFTREFGARDQALIAVGDGLLLAAPEAAAANASDPARVLGSPVEAVAIAGSAQQQALRRLGVEVEMWLPGLALNRERERRGELAITALWFWGGGKGSLPVLQAGTPPWEQAYGGDPWVHGIWRRLANGKVLAARGWDDAQSSALMVVSAARSSLPQLESAWFAPALRDLRAGRMSSLALRIGGQRWDLGSRPRSRWWQPLAWQKPRPWWQVLAA